LRSVVGRIGLAATRQRGAWGWSAETRSAGASRLTMKQISSQHVALAA
jgi:hypothetical protein